MAKLIQRGQKGKKEGVGLQGVGMEEHIQASGGASGPSQTQVVADTPLPPRNEME